MQWLVRLGIGVSIVGIAVMLTLALRPGPSEATGVVDGPVVAVSSPGLPMADVRGGLNLRGDCLMLGDAVVFWPAGTSWDAESQSVVFSGDFDGAVSVGSHFEAAAGSTPRPATFWVLWVRPETSCGTASRRRARETSYSPTPDVPR